LKTNVLPVFSSPNTDFPIFQRFFIAACLGRSVVLKHSEHAYWHYFPVSSLFAPLLLTPY